MNAINIIHPYKSGQVWVFDDDRVGLLAEPFVGGTSEIIDCLVGGIPNATSGVTLIFSGSPFPDYQCCVSGVTSGSMPMSMPRMRAGRGRRRRRPGWRACSMDATVEIVVEVTLEDIARAERGTNYSPAFYAFQRSYGRDVLIMKGPSRAAAQDKWQDHRSWIACLPVEKTSDTVDYMLPSEWQKLLDFWSYGPGNDPEGPSELYRTHVKPISLTLPASK